MFIDRRIFKIKVGRMQEALALANAERVRTHQQYSYIGSFRYMVSLVADFDTLVFESEWSSLADWERYWQEWGADPESAVFLQKNRGNDGKWWRKSTMDGCGITPRILWNFCGKIACVSAL